MRKSLGPIVAVLLVAASTYADASPVLTASQVTALKLPDVRIETAVHHDGSEARGGVSVAHVDVKGVIGGSIRFELLLPDEWNGRFAMGGGGGACTCMLALASAAPPFPSSQRTVTV